MGNRTDQDRTTLLSLISSPPFMSPKETSAQDKVAAAAGSEMEHSLEQSSEKELLHGLLHSSISSAELGSHAALLDLWAWVGLTGSSQRTAAAAGQGRAPGYARYQSGCGGEGSWHSDLVHKYKRKSHCQGFPPSHRQLSRWHCG